MQSPDPFGWVGATIDGQFAVEAIAGDGGYGIVYRATHLGLDTPVAIKCLLVPAYLSGAERERFVASFRKEARILHRLSRQTASIVQALDIGAATAPTGRWTPYMVMEWLEGETLENDLARRRASRLAPRSAEETLQLLAPVAEALSVAHEDSVSHRDVKPANLFLMRSRSGPWMKVLDFGIAKVFSETPSLSSALVKTSEGHRVLTPSYAAPEQFVSEYGVSGPWTDVFAMALILVEVASGRRVLEGDNLIELCVASVEAHQRPDLFSGVVGLNLAMTDVLRRALAPTAGDRFRTMTEFWSALQQARRAGTPEALGPTLSAAELPPDRPQAPSPAPRLHLKSVVTMTEGGPIPSLPALQAASVRTETGEVSQNPKNALKSTGENRICTVMYVDLSSVGELSTRLDEEEIKEVFDRCLAVVKEQVEGFGGAVERSAGDRTIAVFGVPRSTDNDVERAVTAALRIQAALGRLPLPRAARSARLTARIGINTGRVFARMTDRSGRLEVNVVGAPVKVAMRLQEAAPAGAIAIRRDTYRQITGRFNVQPFAAIDAAGQPDPVLCYLVTSAIAVQSSFSPPDFHGIETKRVGRAAEHQRIAEAIETVTSERRARCVTLLGQPGVGRSRLLADLFPVLTVRRETFLVLTTQCSPLAEDSSYSVAAALLRRSFDIREGDSPQRVRRKLRVGLRWFRLCNSMLRSKDGGTSAGISPARPAREHLDPTELDAARIQIEGILVTATQKDAGARSSTLDEPGRLVKHRLAAAAALLLRFAAQQVPVVMLCDDLQWADDASLDLLDDLVQRGHDLPLLMVCSARTELLERRAGWGADEEAHERIDVAPLARRYIEEMVRDRLRRLRDLSPDLVRVLADRAEGNPLILEETLHLLLDAGVIEAHGDDPWIFHAERLSALTLPTTIQRIVQARLDRLDPEARHALALAAVIGRTFWQGALENLRRADPESASAPSTEALLAELRRRHLIRIRDQSLIPGEREASFAESATQEVAYETLSAKVRRALHLQVAGWLEQHATPGAGASTALLAVHYEHGGAAARAAAAYIQTAVNATSLGDNAEALRHLDRARAIHDRDGVEAPQSGRWNGEEQRIASFRDRVRLRLDLGDALRRAGRLDDADRAYLEARARVLRFERRRPGVMLDPIEALSWDSRIDARLALLNEVRGSTSEACSLIARAIASATAAGNIEETPAMYARLASLLRRDRRPEESWKAVRTGLRICQQISRRDERWLDNAAVVLLGVGVALFTRGRLVSSERTHRQVARLVPESTHPHLVASALNGVGVARLARDDLRGARENFLRSLRLKERGGDLNEIASGYSNLAEVELRMNEISAALMHARRAVQLGEQCRAGSDLADMYRNLAEASMAGGEFEAAIDAGLRALVIAEVRGRVYLGAVGLTLARALARAGELSSRSPSLDVRLVEATAVLRTSLSKHFSDGDGELRRQAEECNSLLARPPRT